MNRKSINEKAAFTATTAACLKELQAVLRNRRADLDHEWDALDEGWKELEAKMVTIGIIKPVVLDDALIHLNVGGLHLNVRRAVIDSMCQKPVKDWALANLFDGVWDSRVPRDRDGRIFLDESPVILKYLVHTKLEASMTTHNSKNVILRDFITRPVSLADHQRPHLLNVARVLRLDIPFLGMEVKGDSTMLSTNELEELSFYVRNWCPGDPQGLELIYRASRDGFNASGFHTKCTDESPSTITLMKICDADFNSSSSSSNCSTNTSTSTSTSTSVVGGFSSVPWVPTANNQHASYPSNKWGSSISYSNKDSPGAFIFMAKNGLAKRRGECHPVIWNLPLGPAGHPAIRCGTELGPDFGSGGYGVNFILRKLFFGENTTAPFQILNEKKIISEIEVYRLRYGPRDAASGVSGVTEICSTELMQGYADIIYGGQVNNVSMFASMAGVIMEERMALLNAEAELMFAGEKVQAAACALAAVYGPDIASGKPDPIVELDVCGTTMATLRSTLQACPESALAARFDDSKWPSDGKNFGVIDCSPTIFAKVLDVLRLRKRAMWSQEKEADTVKVPHVVITAGDRASFEEFVDMYFSGYKAFVMDWVSFQDF